MKKLDKKACKEISNWMHRNAREVELALWKYCFENGDPGAVPAALEPYRNSDGGFGNTLEPDSWNPGSTVTTTQYAIFLIRTAGFSGGHPLFKGILEFFEKAEQKDNGGWLFSVPENDGYPHAPWWTYSEKENANQGPGLNAEVSAFILRFADPGSALYKKALAYAADFFTKYKEENPSGEMGASGAGSLIAVIEEEGITIGADYATLKNRMPAIVNGAIERDSAKWQFYTVRPSLIIRSPESPFYKGNEDIVNAELDYLIDTRNPGGVWENPWTWFDNTPKYPAEWTLSQNWWRAVKAIERVEFLRNFGRLEM